MSKNDTSSVDDQQVQAAILSNIAKQQVDYVRPNKLRKLICRQVEGATWTQFKACLENLVKDGKVVMEKNSSGEDQIVAKGGTKQQQQQPTDTTEEDIHSPATNNVVLKTKNVKVPRAIALHLVRRGGLKKTNIEQNTKTKLTVHGIGATSEGLPLSDMVTVQIIRERLDHNPTAEQEELMLAEKHVKTAQLLLQKMADSYKKFPDRFAPKKAGGTFEEQEQYAKEQQARAVANNSKHKKFNNNDKKDPAQIPHGAKSHSTKRKKKEKFY